MKWSNLDTEDALIEQQKQQAAAGAVVEPRQGEEKPVPVAVVPITGAVKQQSGPDLLEMAEGLDHKVKKMKGEMKKIIDEI